MNEELDLHSFPDGLYFLTVTCLYRVTVGLFEKEIVNYEL